MSHFPICASTLNNCQDVKFMGDLKWWDERGVLRWSCHRTIVPRPCLTTYPDVLQLWAQPRNVLIVTQSEVRKFVKSCSHESAGSCPVGQTNQYYLQGTIKLSVCGRRWIKKSSSVYGTKVGRKNYSDSLKWCNHHLGQLSLASLCGR